MTTITTTTKFNVRKRTNPGSFKTNSCTFLFSIFPSMSDDVVWFVTLRLKVLVCAIQVQNFVIIFYYVKTSYIIILHVEIILVSVCKY